MTSRFAGTARISAVADSCVIHDPYPVLTRTYVASLALSMSLIKLFFFHELREEVGARGNGGY